ncbi:MAG TPA: hypothetical protein VNX01_01515, partial [Bacteroidia bacterium]|nr:hypothetical protein [Bacteroidia bacterium]
MNKLYYAASLLALTSLSVLTGCKKDTTPFPTNPQSNGVYPDLAYTTPWFPTIYDADGIFISNQVTDEKTVIISPYRNLYEYGMAKVTGTTGNFNNLIDAGNVTLNDSVLVKSTALSYLSSITNYTLNLSNTAAWSISGNASVPTMTNTLSGANNPTYLNDVTTWDTKWTPILPRPLTVGSSTYHLDSLYNATVQYSIPVKTANADSTIIFMTDNVNGLVYKRTCLSTDTVANFKPNDFPISTVYDLPSFKLQISAIKYNHKDTLFGG